MVASRTQDRTSTSPTHADETCPPPEPCPLTAALQVLGGRWNLIVLYWLTGGTRRFSDLQRLIPGVTHKMLTSTLRQLESAGVVDRRVYPEVPPRVEYSLSDHGRSAEPVIEAMRQWGHKHLERGGLGRGGSSPRAGTP